MWTHILDRISFWSLYLTIALLPLFFFPVWNIPIEVGKGFLLVLGLSISIIFYLSARFSDGKIRVAKSYLLLSGLVLALATLFSAVFSNSLHVSLFGTMLDISSALFILGCFLLMLMSSIVFRDHNKAKKVLFGGLISMGIVFFFQILYLLLPKLLSVGVLVERNDNIFGSWNSLGIASGLTLLISVFVLEFFSLSKRNKILIYVLSVFSLFFIIAVNFALVWKVLGIFAMLVFVYKVAVYSNKEKEGNHFRFPAFSFALVMISLLFFMSGQFIGGIVPRALNISNIEVGPSLGSTISIARSSLVKDPLFGIGPNKFGEIWALSKPISVNVTQFWDTDFSIGSGYVPTMALTTGILGILSWLLFLGLMIYFGTKILFKGIGGDVLWEAPLFFLAGLFLFVSAFFYSANSAIVLLAFAFLGIFIGIHYSNTENGEIEISFFGDPRKSFFVILALILCMIITAGTAFKYVEKFASVPYFRSALSSSTVEEAELAINKALSLYNNDLYLRTFSQIYLIKLNKIVSSGEKLSDEESVLLKNTFENALLSAQKAVEYDKNNYVNLRALASVYSSVVPIGVEGSLEKAVEVFNSASLLNPLNPGLKLAIAQVYLSSNKLDEAKEYSKQALELKNNYVDALIFLSQIAKKEGNNTEAISYAKKALEILPNNQDLIDYVASFGVSKNIEPTVDITKEEITDTKKDEKKKTN